MDPHASQISAHPRQRHTLTDLRQHGDRLFVVKGRSIDAASVGRSVSSFCGCGGDGEKVRRLSTCTDIGKHVEEDERETALARGICCTRRD